MKWISSAIIILLFSIFQPAVACTCFGSGYTYDKPILIMMSCENNVCQQAVEIQFATRATLAAFIDDSNPEYAEKTYLPFDQEIIPYSVNYPAVMDSYLPLAQSKIPQLNGVYKMIVVKPQTQPYAANPLQTLVNIVQTSAQPNSSNFGDIAKRYQDAANEYTAYTMSGNTITIATYTLGILSICLYLFFLILNSIILLSKKVITSDIQNLILNQKSYLRYYGVTLVFFMFALLSPAVIMYLQNTIPHFVDYYRIIVTVYIAAFIAVSLIIYSYQRQPGFFAAVYTLQRTLLFVSCAALCNFFGLLYASSSAPIAVPLFFNAISLSIISLPILIYADGANQLDENNKSAYIKLQAKIILFFAVLLTNLLLVPVIQMFNLLFYYILIRLAYALMDLWLLISIPVLIVYVYRLSNLGFKKRKIVLKILPMIVGIFLTFVFAASSSCNCDNAAQYRSPLYDRNLTQYFNYTKGLNIRN